MNFSSLFNFCNSALGNHCSRCLQRVWLVVVVVWSQAQRCLVSCVSQVVLPGVVLAVLLVMRSGLSALLQFTSIWGTMATGYLCFWWGFCHGSGDRCLRAKGGDLRIPKLKRDLLQLLYRALHNKEKCTADGASSSCGSKCVCSVQVAHKIYIYSHVPGDVSFVQRRSPAAHGVLSSQQAGGSLKPRDTQFLGVFGCWFSGEAYIGLLVVDIW